MKDRREPGTHPGETAGTSPVSAPENPSYVRPLQERLAERGLLGAQEQVELVARVKELEKLLVLGETVTVVGGVAYCNRCGDPTVNNDCCREDRG